MKDVTSWDGRRMIMAQTGRLRVDRGLLATLLGVGLLFSACSGDECVSGPECTSDDVTVTGTINGTVAVGAQGLANMTVTLSDGATASTASNGSYSFSELLLGSYTVTVSGLPSGVSCSVFVQSVTLSDSESQATVDFTCQSLDIGTPPGLLRSAGPNP